MPSVLATNILTRSATLARYTLKSGVRPSVSCMSQDDIVSKRRAVPLWLLNLLFEFTLSCQQDFAFIASVKSVRHSRISDAFWIRTCHFIVVVSINNSSILHHFRDITIFAVYVTACDPENSFTFDTIVDITGSVAHGSILCDPIQPNPSTDWPNPTQPSPLQVKKIGANPTQPNTTNNKACSLVVTYFIHRADRFAVPVRSAVKSNLTAWCN